jgi:protein ImuB
MPSRRILSIWFPRLAAERVLRAEPQLAAQPLTVVVDRRGATAIESAPCLL